MAKQATNRSNKHTVSLPAQDRNSPQRPDADPPLDISSFNKKDVPVRPAYRRPFYHPESPRCSSLDPSFVQQTTAENSMAAPSIKGLTSPDVGELEGTPKKTLAADHGSVKRKHVVVEDDLPSSSPLGPIFTPKCRRRNGSEWPLEIPSTPDASPANKIRKSSPPLFIDLDLEENMLGLEGDSPEEDDRQLDQQPPDTLSEPDRQDPDTQAVFTDATQPIDFNVIPPEDGWDDEDNEYEKTSNLNRFDIPPTRVGWDTSPRFHTSSLHIADTELSDLQPVLADTQAILKDKTQTPDFSIPDPDDGWNNLIRLSPPPVPNSPHAKSDESSAANNEQFDAWLDSHVTKSISVEQVENVLKCTNMNTSLADDVLRYLAKKGHVPKNRKGVWTAADDEDLKSTNARKIQKLQEKHGAECLAARWEFLDFYAGA